MLTGMYGCCNCIACVSDTTMPRSSKLDKSAMHLAGIVLTRLQHYCDMHDKTVMYLYCKYSFLSTFGSILFIHNACLIKE